MRHAITCSTGQPSASVRDTVQRSVAVFDRARSTLTVQVPRVRDVLHPQPLHPGVLLVAVDLDPQRLDRIALLSHQEREIDRAAAAERGEHELEGRQAQYPFTSTVSCVPCLFVAVGVVRMLCTVISRCRLPVIRPG